MKQNPRYDFDYGPDGPLAPLYERTPPDYPHYMIAPPIGWVDLVLDLDRRLAELAPNYTIQQVKEKFGGLRYYVTLDLDPKDPTYTEATDLIREAERKSYSICQLCGGPGKLDDSQPWYVTVCPTCQEQEKD